MNSIYVGTGGFAVAGASAEADVTATHRIAGSCRAALPIQDAAPLLVRPTESVFTGVPPPCGADSPAVAVRLFSTLAYACRGHRPIPMFSRRRDDGCHIFLEQVAFLH
jgi:hypothetical protein